MIGQTYAIVGGGLAGASAAEALRGEGFDGRIVLIGDEREAPYQRPPLSKEFLRGEITREAVSLRSAEFYSRNAIEVRTGEPIARVDVRGHRIEYASGSQLAYNKLLIATGAVPRRLTVPGNELRGVCYLRTLEDSLRLRKLLGHRPRVLAVGAGFIGCEVAASSRTMGCEVTLTDRVLPMAHALGVEVGAFYAEYHRSRGAKLKTGVTVEGFRGKDRLEEAILSDGTTVACDVAVIGVGVIPTVHWLPDELRRSDGLEADEFCRTNVDDIFAAGDIACSWRPRFERRLRLEHFDNAGLQGAAAGRAMSGKLEPFDPIPFFWSYQYDLDLQYYGFASRFDQVIMRGRPTDGSFIAFYINGGRLEAACAVNRSRETSSIKRLIGQIGIPAQLLGDEHVALKDVSAPQAHGTHD